MRRGYREQEERLARRLEGKICLVTAGAQGIGRASALAFAQEGARVLATDINEQELEKLGKAHPLEVARLDVSRREDIDGLLLNRSFDVVLIGAFSKAEFATTFPKVYKGRHVSHAKIEIIRARELVVDAPSPLPIVLDGEQPGTTPVRFELLPSALRVRVPA